MFIEILEIISVILMGIGGIFSFVEIRKKLRKIKDDALLDIAKMSFPSIVQEIFEDSLPRIISNEKDKEKQEKYKEWLKEVKEPLPIKYYLIYYIAMTYLFVKHTIFKFLSHKTGKLGISLIVIGILLFITSKILSHK